MSYFITSCIALIIGIIIGRIYEKDERPNVDAIKPSFPGSDKAYQDKTLSNNDENSDLKAEKSKLINEWNQVAELRLELEKEKSANETVLSAITKERLTIERMASYGGPLGFARWMAADYTDRLSALVEDARYRLRANATRVRDQLLVANTLLKEHASRAVEAELKLELLKRELPQAIDLVTEDAGETQPEGGSVPEPDWSALPTAQRSQMELERWVRRRKASAWIAGIDYEGYVAWKLEQDGFTVERRGEILGLDDLGIDLIARRPGVVWCIQCKRRKELIRENTIAQIFGSASYWKAARENDARPVIFTSGNLSEVARAFADQLGVQVHDAVSLDEYPRIKCHINDVGEKIYHLPMDQQYHQVRLHQETGDRTVLTAMEAERLGFRRAMRWSGEGA